MKEKPIRNLAVTPDSHVDNESEDLSSKHLFSGLNIAGVVEQLKKSRSFYEANHSNKPAVSPDVHSLPVDTKPENQTAPSPFYGLNPVSSNMIEQLKIYFSPSEPASSKKPVDDDFPKVKHHTPEIHLSKIRTADVITSLIKVKANKRVKESTLATYKKRWYLFQQQFAFLPENPEAIMHYLSRFNGKSGRHRRNQQDLLSMLYTHATRRFNLSNNPMVDLERPIVTRKPVKTLSLEQIRVLNSTPENLQERTALDFLIGHGWRQIEIRRVQAKDVVAIDQHLILCHGKEREELAPVLPETVNRLREMAGNLDPDDFLFVAKYSRHGCRVPLGEDGMSQLIERLLARAGIEGFTGHDLRRTFTTIVTTASHDEFLAMRLIRDRVPGQSDRYIRYPMCRLVEALEKYSPIRLAEDSWQNDDYPGISIQKVSTTALQENSDVETVKESGGDGGESNSPSKRSCPGHTTSLVSSFILPGLPQLTELHQASRLIFRHPYQRPDRGTPAFRHPIPARRGEAQVGWQPI